MARSNGQYPASAYRPHPLPCCARYGEHVAPVGFHQPRCRLLVWRQQRPERCGGVALDDGSVKGVAGPVAGAVPGLFVVVERDIAAEVGAAARERGQRSVEIAADGGGRPLQAVAGGRCRARLGTRPPRPPILTTLTVSIGLGCAARRCVPSTAACQRPVGASRFVVPDCSQVLPSAFQQGNFAAKRPNVSSSMWAADAIIARVLRVWGVERPTAPAAVEHEQHTPLSRCAASVRIGSATAAAAGMTIRWQQDLPAAK